ncbi:MAG: hypothetical protein R6V49_06830 [Bacteroidales bacterium]
MKSADSPLESGVSRRHRIQEGEQDTGSHQTPFTSLLLSFD